MKISFPKLNNRDISIENHKNLKKPFLSPINSTKNPILSSINNKIRVKTQQNLEENTHKDNQYICLPDVNGIYNNSDLQTKTYNKKEIFKKSIKTSKENLEEGVQMKKKRRNNGKNKKITINYVFLAKLQSYHNFILKINLSNGILIKPEKIPYRIFIGKGNNSELIRNVIKERWWWQLCDSFDSNVNFLWTQLKNQEFLEKIPQNQKNYNISKEKSIEDYSSKIQKSIETSDLSSLTQSSSLINHINRRNMSKSLTNISQDLKKHSFTDISIESKNIEIYKSRKNNIAFYKNLRKILNFEDFQLIQAYDEQSIEAKYIENYKNLQKIPDFIHRNDNQISQDSIKNQDFLDMYKKIKADFKPFMHKNQENFKMHNHLENNYMLSNKKCLLYNMRYYYESIKKDVFATLPLTFHIQQGLQDPEFTRFLTYFNKYKRTYWIIKPGEQTNRGIGISVCNEIQQIEQILCKIEKHPNGKPKTYLIQRYIESPFLYNRRKFDIRCYMLITSNNGIIKGYWYEDGYIRTASKEFTLKNVENKLIHLTNDAVQKKGDDYGKYEDGNKLSFYEFQRYIDLLKINSKINFIKEIYPKIKKIGSDAIKATFLQIDPYRREFSFEIFGLDFMIDEDYKPWLLEVNTNPCLELSSLLLAKLIPNMVENAFRIAVDPIFPPPEISLWNSAKKPFISENLLEFNKFELIFDQISDEKDLKNMNLNRNSIAGEQIYEIEEENENNA